jgi:sortase A
MTRTTRGAIVWVERWLLIGGVVCLGWYGYATASASAFQAEQHARFAREMAARPAGEATPIAPAGGGAEAESADALLGLIEIPRLGLSAPVMSGDDQSVLSAAAGHLPDTPRPWEAGNSAIAAHRDGLFRSLKGIRRGDVVRLRTRLGDLEYRVDETRIVQPSDLSVLAPRRADSVTLITCYPFNFVGSAPQRFIVHAERIGGHPKAAGLLPSRSLAVVTAYRASSQQVPGVVDGRAGTTGSSEGPRVKSRAPRAPRAASATGRSGARHPEVGTRRDGRDAVTRRDRGASGNAVSDRAEKRRRWFHFWRR